MVDKQVLKRIIQEYQSLLSDIVLIQRNCCNMDVNGAVFVGLRRVGKSYLLYQQMNRLVTKGSAWTDFLYINFEDERLDLFDINDFDTLVQSYKELYDKNPIFFLDEIHVVGGWEKFVRRLADQKYHIYITGSNAKMLSSELASTLGGRLMEIRVYPFSFEEYLKCKGITLCEHWDIKQCTQLAGKVEEYMIYGGMPEVIFATNEMKRTTLSNQFNAIFFRDIIIRYSIRSEAPLKALVRKLAESVMQPISLNRLAHIVSSSGQKIKTETVSSYVGYLIESLLIFPVENMAATLSERLSVRKYYYTDNGFISLFVNNPMAHLLENIVACKLYNQYRDDLYFYNHNIEVDFVIPSQGKAIQVSADLYMADTLQRECKALITLQGYNDILADLIIITIGEERSIYYDNKEIHIIPLWKFLLS